VGYENAAQKCFLNIPPDSAFGGESPYRFSAVDGGVIDNEPLELARRYLAGGPQKHNDQNGEAANKAVVLIAPFPSFRAPPVADETLKLIHLLPHLGSALIDQARFKLDELEQATNERIFSRFMVSPVRHSNKTPAAVALPIASGAMGGFSGFLHESFRHHDYLLGRRNMQAFLRWNFALPETNLLFKNVDINKQRWQVGNADKATGSLGPAADRALPSKLFAARVDEAPSTPGFPIIPLVDRLRTPIDIGPDDMPKPGAISLDDIRSWIKKRADIVVATLVDVDLRKETDMLPWPLAKSLRFGARQFGSQIGTEKAFAVVKQAVAQVQAAFA
jgi:hypothetical protein